jgi:hypothetical protein
VTESILVWLGLKDLIAATKVSREWRASVITMRVGSLSVFHVSEGPQPCVIGRHITEFTVFGRCTPSYIVALARVAPHLTDLDLGFFDATDDEFHAMVNALVHVSSLTRLVVVCASYKSISDTHIAEIRRLGHLREFFHSAATYNPDFMQRVLTTPHSLQWQNIGWIYDSAILQSLPHLPSLTRLHIFDNMLRGWKLASLPNLKHLALMGSGIDMDAFEGCHTLTSVTIHGPRQLEWLKAPELCASLRSLTLCSKKSGTSIDVEQLNHILHVKHLHELTIDTHLLTAYFESTPEFTQLRLPCAALPALHTLTLKEG